MNKNWWRIDWRNHSQEIYNQKDLGAQIEHSIRPRETLTLSLPGENGRLTARYDCDSKELALTNCGHDLTSNDYQRILSLTEPILKGTLPPEIKNNARTVFELAQRKYFVHQTNRLLTYQPQDSISSPLHLQDI